MKKEVFSFLRNLSSLDPQVINSLIVSSFLHCNNIIVKKNEFIIDYIVKENDELNYKNFIALNKLIDTESKSFNFENLIELFEFVVSPKDKIITGAIYTPAFIRSFIINEAVQFKKASLSSAFFADISCGCGSFLFDIAQRLNAETGKKYFEIFKDQIFGLDIQEYSIVRTKILLTLLAISKGEDRKEFIFNLKVGDALNYKWADIYLNFKGFDVIVGNPPYVCSRSIPNNSKQYLTNWQVCGSGHPDLYIPFFQIGIENLKKNGILGYITMNTFFKSVNGRSLRKYFQDESFTFKIIDFGAIQIFNSKSTYTCLCFIEKTKSEVLKFAQCKSILDLNNKIVFSSLKYSGLNYLKGWNLTIHNAEIQKIESIGIPLSERFKSRNGIATLKNNVYIFKPKEQDHNYFYLESEEYLYPIEKEICRDIVNPNMLTNEDSLDNLMEKIIFPYEFIDNNAVVIKDKKFRTNYPSAYNYLVTKKEILKERDKGDGAFYSPWYKFGRNQSLEKFKYKMLFPHIASKTPNYVIDLNENLLFYNGISIIGENEIELIILNKILSSKIFWFYIENTSKPYGDKYYSLSKNYFKNFGIPIFTPIEENFILSEEDEVKLDTFFEEKYGVSLLK